VALTEFQRTVCRLLAQTRIETRDSCDPAGSALGETTTSARLSRDVDLFHDRVAAVATGWSADRRILESEGFSVEVLRERPGFVDANVSRAGEVVLVQWAADSAYRFFPLVAHPDFGLTLHPFDLATNKVLALVGRVEARDRIDVIASHERNQRLGYLVWAACGKDPGFGPKSILEEAGRSGRYAVPEIESLDFDGEPPDAATLSRR